ncbi:hypothetical protein A2U01_0091306 [Trifolium medium]|uniref:Uncharacterized protein n=1 Tax=Trifolium medium TaxID=97028 RepID=A0A392U965_9FABA|nr:hypothetical protein [Trifolium medium]
MPAVARFRPARSGEILAACRQISPTCQKFLPFFHYSSPGEA